MERFYFREPAGKHFNQEVVEVTHGYLPTDASLAYREQERARTFWSASTSKSSHVPNESLQPRTLQLVTVRDSLYLQMKSLRP